LSYKSKQHEEMAATCWKRSDIDLWVLNFL